MSVFSWIFPLFWCFEIHNIAENTNGKIVKVRGKGNVAVFNRVENTGMNIGHGVDGADPHSL